MSLATIEHQATATRFDPDARAFEAFSLGGKTALLDPVQAASLDLALAEVTERHSFDRGDRIGVRELGEGVDLLHVYAVRRTSTATSFRPCYDQPYGRTPLEYKRRLEHVCTVDLRAIAGAFVDGSDNPSLNEHNRRKHDERQQQRPDGARGLNEGLRR